MSFLYNTVEIHLKFEECQINIYFILWVLSYVTIIEIAEIDHIKANNRSYKS